MEKNHLLGSSVLGYRQRGLSLMEVLVSIVVLSVGLLGVAGLQVAGIKVSQSSQFRAQAAQLAEDMADRMRANVAAAKAESYDRNIGDAEPGTGSAVALEVTEWLRRLRDLPGGNGQINANPASNTVEIRVQWNDSRGTDGSATEQFVLVTSLWN